MSQDATPPNPRRRRNPVVLWIAIGVVVLLIPPAAGLLLNRRPASEFKLGTDVPSSLRADRERTVAAHVERAENEEWGSAGGDRMLCAAQELGEEPFPGQPGRIRVYVWVVCSSADSARAGDSGPLTVDIGGSKAPVTSFEPRPNDPTSIRTHFPQQLWNAAIDKQGIDTKRLERELNQRS